MDECGFANILGANQEYRIKIFWLCDASSGFCLKGLVYIGRGTLNDNELNAAGSVSESIVMNLFQPYPNKGYNVVARGW